MLILAGLRLETDLKDPETVQLITEVLENFDPNQSMNEDEAMFSSRFHDFERKKRNSGSNNVRERHKATKKVTEEYNVKRAKREREE